MVSKILKVFYGADYLPYKDSERTIHFPVGGNTFAGTQNTFRICFYPRDLVGSNDLVEQTSWVLVSKLPNGKLGYQLLNAINTDSDLGEKYLVFDLSSYYSQYKGVVKLAIRGYQGEISFVEDDDTGTYSVQGTPIIGVTGTIDIAINYSPMVYGEELLPSELDQLVAMFSQYLTLNAYQEDSIKRIVVVDNLDEEIATLTNTYEHGQLFYNKADKKIYVFDETEDDIVLFDNAVKIIEGASNTLTINEVIANGTPVIVVLHNNIRHTTMPYLVSQTQNNTRKTIEAMPLYDNSISYSALNTQLDFSSLFTTLLVSDYKIELATKDYVDEQISSFLQNEYSKVDTTTYPTLDDFLASTGEEGYIYLYPINTSDESQGYYQYIWENNAWVSLGSTQIDLSVYVEKTSSANKVYGTNELGAQTTYTVDDFYDGNIARRDSDGSVTVPLTPAQNGHASSKKYVDDLTTLKTLNGVDLHGTGNIAYDDELDSVSTNAVQNKVLNAELTTTKDELAQLKSIVYETTIEEDSFEEQHLQESALPLSVNSKSIVFSAGMDNTDIKGRSFVYNQLVQNGNFESNDNWSLINNSYVSLSVSNNKATITSLIAGGNPTYYGLIQNTNNVINGHKYLVSAKVKSSVQASVYAYFSASGNNVNMGNSTTNENTLFGLITATSNSTSIRVSCIISTNVGDNYEISNIQLFDLTQSSIDSATTVDEAIALLQQNGINPYEYNEYYTGKIVDSKPTKLIVKSSNSELTRNIPNEYQQVEYIESTGTQYIDIGIKGDFNTDVELTFQLTELNTTSGNQFFGSRDSYTGNSAKSLYIGSSTSGFFYGQFDDIAPTVLQTISGDLLKHTTRLNKNGWYLDNVLYRTYGGATAFTTSTNLFMFAGVNGEAGLQPTKVKIYSCKITKSNVLVADLVPCYRKEDNVVGMYDLISNQFLVNGGTGSFVKGSNVFYYEINLSTPILKSSLNTQDDRDFVKVITIDLGSFEYGTYNTLNCWRTTVSLSNIKTGIVSERVDALCSKYLPASFNNASSQDNILFTDSDARLYIKDTTNLPLTKTPEEVKTFLNGIKVNFALRVPVSQTPFNLPENIKIEKGGYIETTYDSTATTPSDFDFKVATYKPMEE